MAGKALTKGKRRAHRRRQRRNRRLLTLAAALAVLGYSSAECAAALKGIDMQLPLEEIIRTALRGMTK